MVDALTAPPAREKVSKIKYEFEEEHAVRFASERGFETREHGRELQFKRCPYCIDNAPREDKWTFSINLDNGAYNCLRASCGVQGHFIQLARDFDFDVIDEQERQFARLPQVKIYSSDKAKEYLGNRGISEEVADKYRISTLPENPNILVIPFYRVEKDADGKVYEHLECCKYRKTDFDKSKGDSKEWFQKDCKPILFGMDQCDGKGTLVITEGQMDALACATAGVKNPVSVPGGANSFKWVPFCRKFVEQFDEIVVFGDCEKGKITLVDGIRKNFPRMRIRVPRMRDYLQEKDANDILLNFGAESVRKVVDNAIEARPNGIVSISSICYDDGNDEPIVKTLLKNVDSRIGGIFRGQLVELCGKTGMGKSTFASQLVANATIMGCKSLIYSGELCDSELKKKLYRQIAGMKEINRNDQSVFENTRKEIDEYLDGKVFKVDNQIIDAVDDSDMLKSLTDSIEDAYSTYGIDFVVVDNLMTVAECGDRELSSQRKIAQRLKSLARSLNIAVLLVVHPRKESTKSLTVDSVAGNSAVTNLADTLIAIDRIDTEDGKSCPAMSILKNRRNGKRMEAIEEPLDYYALSCQMVEAGCDELRYMQSIRKKNYGNQL